MKLPGAIRKLSFDDRWLQFVLLAFMVLYYGLILCHAELQKPAIPLNKTFNNMLDHLMHGQFDVDPNIIGDEGFLRNGRVYAYWGITCALLRLPLLLLHKLDLDITVWSCLVAVCLAGMMKVRTVLFLRRSCSATSASEAAFGFMLIYIVLGGAEVGFLMSSIYQEVVFWAIAFAAVFVYFAIKGIVSREFTSTTLSWMAFAAGVALLTRVSTGIGLCVAFGLLLLVLLAEDVRTKRAVLTRRILVPATILVALLIVAGTVNYYRWGNPTTFADYTLYLGNRFYPDRIPRTDLYGLFNLARIPFGLSYYFLPIWVLQGRDGRLLFENTQIRLMDNVELPPSSYFLTDLLPIAFIVFLIMAVWAGRSIVSGSLRKSRELVGLGDPQSSHQFLSYAQGLALAIGLAVPCVLMLTAISMNYRYRMEFYPEMDLLAFLGLYATVSDPALLARFNRHRSRMLAATIISIVSAFVAMFLYRHSPFGPAQLYLHNGVFHFYFGDWRVPKP